MSSTKPPAEALKQAEEIAGYIARNYPNARKVVELGVGHAPWTALKLRELLPDTEILAVDKDPEALRGLEARGIRALRDDILNPRVESYRGACLLYSIHPPIELLNPMKALAGEIGSELLVKPLSEDAYLYGFRGWRRVRVGPYTIYLWSRV